MLRHSRSLWAREPLDLGIADGCEPAYASSQLAWLSTHEGVAAASLAVEPGGWPDAAAALSKLDSCLRRLALSAALGAELGGAQSFLWALRGLTALKLDAVVHTLNNAVTLLTALRELAVACGGPCDDFFVPDGLVSLAPSLTSLRLRRCLCYLPPALAALTGLQDLSLEGSILHDTTPEAIE